MLLEFTAKMATTNRKCFSCTHNLHCVRM